tara:strand:- start:1442 stop:2083 length:642 start_codon:yes stop_codon:yes gene_type:complete
MTIKSYLADSSLATTAEVTRLDADASTVRLSATLFHPQGGGQKADHGLIGTARVLDVRHAPDGEVDHFVDTIEGLAVGSEVALQVDPGKRQQHARYHSAGHLIADAMTLIDSGARAVQGHHWPGEARVEFESTSIDAESVLARLQESVDGLILQDLPLQICGDPMSSRALKIGNFPAVGCGGTHVTSTADLAQLTITRARSRKGRLRVSYDFE